MRQNTLTVTRKGRGEWRRGVYEVFESSTFIIIGSVQPLMPNQALLLPEARRTRANIVIYTSSPLVTTNTAAQTEADLVSYNGISYEVHQVRDWSVGKGLPHFQAIASKVDGEP
jgi:hypothetical protein